MQISVIQCEGGESEGPPRETKEERFNKRYLQRQAELKEEADKKLAEKYGSVATNLRGRKFLSRRAATIYILCLFYRRLALAAIILLLYETPSAQVILTLVLNLAYMMMLVQIKPFLSRTEYTRELINESVILTTIYFLMCFTEHFILEA